MTKRLLLLLCCAAFVCFAQSRKAEEFPTLAGEVRLTPIAHASFLLQADGKNIYIDPAMGNFEGLPKADLIIITDIHPDHLAPEKIDQLKKASTVVMAPEAVAKTVTGARVMHYGDSALSSALPAARRSGR